MSAKFFDHYHQLDFYAMRFHALSAVLSVDLTDSIFSKLLLTRVLSLSVDLADVELDGAVLLRGNETVGGRALARDIKVNDHTFVVLHLDFF